LTTFSYTLYEESFLNACCLWEESFDFWWKRGANPKNIEHALPELMKKYRACHETMNWWKNIEHGKFVKQIYYKSSEKFHAKPIKSEYFQKGASLHQKSNGQSLSILSNARRLWKNELAKKSCRYLQTFFDLLKAFHVFVKPR
jgi:hypothetical protein